jgi:hypothetical protein
METVPLSAVNAVDNETPDFGSAIADTQACGPTEVGRRSIHRETLVEKMAGLLPTGTTKLGKHLVGLEDDGLAVKLAFRNETMAQASAVLACDGIRIKLHREGDALRHSCRGGYRLRKGCELPLLQKHERPEDHAYVVSRVRQLAH